MTTTEPRPALGEGLRVVLADDSGIFRRGLSLLLEAAAVDVVAAVSDVPALRSAVAETDPDVAVVDVRMPPSHTDEGIRAAVELRAAHPSLGILVLSTYVNAAWAATLFEAVPGGVGYPLKDQVDDVSSLVEAMRRVAAGGLALDPDVVQMLMAARRHRSPLDRLTVREREVLALIAEGRSNLAIAERLHLSVKTVEMHVAAVFRALDLEAAPDLNRRVMAALAFLGRRAELRREGPGPGSAAPGPVDTAPP